MRVVFRQLEVTEQTCCRWRKERGGAQVGQTKWLRDPERPSMTGQTNAVGFLIDP